MAAFTKISFASPHGWPSVRGWPPDYFFSTVISLSRTGSVP
jgi:hypothetical protein